MNIRKIVTYIICSSIVFISMVSATLAPVIDAAPTTAGELTIVKDKNTTAAIATTKSPAIVTNKAKPNSSIVQASTVSAASTNPTHCNNKQGKLLQDCINAALREQISLR